MSEFEVRIPTFEWKQIGGDMNPGAHGGLIAEATGDHIELIRIQPVVAYVGEGQAREVGFPFWSEEAWFDRFDDEVVWDSAEEDAERQREADEEEDRGRKANHYPGALRPDPRIRYETKWKIGDPGAVYEFNVKFARGDYSAEVDEVAMYREVGRAAEAFGSVLRGRYPWVGDVSIKGRSGGWLAVEDRDGGATREKIGEIADMVDDARVEFGKYLDETYGRRRRKRPRA